MKYKKKKLEILGVVGIRSGSKGIKNKNIKSFLGTPLIGRILKTAKKSKYLNRLIVSTDSQSYAKIAKKYGGEVLYLRPKNISKDKSHEIEFIKDLIKNLKKKESYTPDIIVRLLATVPLQTTNDIDESIKKIIQNVRLDSCFVISEAQQHPLKALKIDQSKNLVSFINSSGSEIGKNQNRNLFQKAYFRSNIIVTRYKTIKKFNSLSGKKNGFHIIPQIRSIDIDTKADFIYAEYLAKYMKSISQKIKKNETRRY